MSRKSGRSSYWNWEKRYCIVLVGSSHPSFGNSFCLFGSTVAIHGRVTEKNKNVGSQQVAAIVCIQIVNIRIQGRAENLLAQTTSQNLTKQEQQCYFNAHKVYLALKLLSSLCMHTRIKKTSKNINKYIKINEN